MVGLESAICHYDSVCYFVVFMCLSKLILSSRYTFMLAQSLLAQASTDIVRLA